MNTEEKLNKFAQEMICKDWVFYLSWMVNSGYSAEQITNRIIDALK